METTLTVRLTLADRERLEAAARRLGRSVSVVVRDILRAALADKTVGERAGHVRGRLRLSPNPERSLIPQLRERNWRR